MHRRPSYRPPPDNEEIKETKTSTSQETDDPQKYRLILEPALVGAMIAINLGQTSLQNFYLQTACTVDLGVDLEVCLKGDMEVSSLYISTLIYYVINVNDNTLSHATMYLYVEHIFMILCTAFYQ